MTKIGVSSASGQIDPTVFAELVSRRWKEARSNYTLNSMLEASWWRRPIRSVLELHWSRRTLCIPNALPGKSLVASHGWYMQ